MSSPRIVRLRTHLFLAYGAVLLAALAAVGAALFATVDMAQLAERTAVENRAELDPALKLAREGRIAEARAHVAVLEATTTDAKPRASKVAVLLGAATATVFLIGVWVSVRLAADITRPLDRIADAAARFGQGEFGQRVPTAGMRELDLLALRFNRMAEALERARATDIERVTQAQRRIETVLESIDDGLLILDGHGCVQRANRVALEQLGVPSGALVGKKLVDQVADATLRAHVEQALLRRAPGGYGGELEIAARGDPPAALPALDRDSGRAAAAVRRLTYALTPFHDGRAPGLVLVLRDVTDQRAFEALRNQFVLRASHELRTPMTGLRMAYDLLAKKVELAPGSREAELLETLGEELDRLGKLIADLFDLSKLHAEANELAGEHVPARALLREAGARFAAKLEQAGIRLELDDAAADADAVVHVERVGIERVFDNLIDNATRHTPRGGSIRLSAARCGGEVEFAVADTGDGIAPAVQERIFEPFTQFGDRTGGGTGLGLALCREILSHHHGHMELTSATGRGARFAFRLPLDPATRASAA